MAEFEQTEAQIRNAIYGVASEAELSAVEAGHAVEESNALSTRLLELITQATEMGNVLRAEVQAAFNEVTPALAEGRNHLGEAKRHLDDVPTSRAGNALLPQIGRVDQIFAEAQGKLEGFADTTDVDAALNGLKAALEAKRADCSTAAEGATAAEKAANKLHTDATEAAEKFH